METGIEFAGVNETLFEDESKSMGSCSLISDLSSSIFSPENNSERSSSLAIGIERHKSIGVFETPTISSLHFFRSSSCSSADATCSSGSSIGFPEANFCLISGFKRSKISSMVLTFSVASFFLD